jgi:hypothetical protein
VVASPVLVCLRLSAGFSQELGGEGVGSRAGFSVLWLVVNGSMEGVVVRTLSPTHRITGAELTGVAGLGQAAYRSLRAATTRG